MDVNTYLSTAASVKQWAKQIEASMDILINSVSAERAGGNVMMKREDGRMAEAGIDALYADFAAAQLTDKEIMQKYDISLSGVTKRKAMWKKGQR